MSVTLDYELLNIVSSKGIDKLKEIAYLGIVYYHQYVIIIVIII